MASESDLRRHVTRLGTILRRYGAEAPAPFLRHLDTGERLFEIGAILPGPSDPGAAEVRLAEVWRQASPDVFRREEYRYEFVERPLNRRRAFHRHHPASFLEGFSVLVHEHCEEVLGEPDCAHYYGPPTDAYEAIQVFAVMWGQPGPIGWGDFRCMD